MDEMGCVVVLPTQGDEIHQTLTTEVLVGAMVKIELLVSTDYAMLRKPILAISGLDRLPSV